MSRMCIFTDQRINDKTYRCLTKAVYIKCVGGVNKSAHAAHIHRKYEKREMLKIPVFPDVFVKWMD